MALTARRLDGGRQLDAAVDEVCHRHEVLLDEASGGHGGGTDADAAGDDGGAVAGHGVLVEGDGGALQHGLHARAVEALGAQVQQHEVVVGAARDQRVPQLQQPRRQRLAVAHHLLLVHCEGRLRGLLERHRQRADGVVVRAALQSREHGVVDRSLEAVAHLPAASEENHAAARTPQRLVRRGGHNVAVLEGVGCHARRHQAAHVRHIRKQQRAH
mmetsp:Transcript_5467/g.19950  ORF Transcript_5467/g.19950 Transcript_5467/m.19950 type:complete len:215 (-) Transcript_5467:873-1517(-)